MHNLCRFATIIVDSRGREWVYILKCYLISSKFDSKEFMTIDNGHGPAYLPITTVLLWASALNNVESVNKGSQPFIQAMSFDQLSQSWPAWEVPFEGAVTPAPRIPAHANNLLAHCEICQVCLPPAKWLLTVNLFIAPICFSAKAAQAAIFAQGGMAWRRRRYKWRG